MNVASQQYVNKINAGFLTRANRHTGSCLIFINEITVVFNINYPLRVPCRPQLSAIRIVATAPERRTRSTQIALIFHSNNSLSVHFIPLPVPFSRLYLHPDGNSFHQFPFICFAFNRRMKKNENVTEVAKLCKFVPH